MELYHLFALIIAVFPLLLLLGIALIPRVANYANHDLAQRAADQSRRWFWGHLLSGIAFGYGILAACCLAVVLYAEDQFLWAMLSLPLICTGAACQAVGMGADGIGPLAVRRAGHPARYFFDGSSPWVVGTFVAGSILFGLGQIILVIGVQHSELLNTTAGIVVLIAAIIFSISTAIPSGWGLYVVGVAAAVIYLPISLALWQHASLLVGP